MKGVGKVFEAVSTFYFNFRSFHKIFRRNDDYGNPRRIPRLPCCRNEYVSAGNGVVGIGGEGKTG